MYESSKSQLMNWISLAAEKRTRTVTAKIETDLLGLEKRWVRRHVICLASPSISRFGYHRKTGTKIDGCSDQRGRTGLFDQNGYIAVAACLVHSVIQTAIDEILAAGNPNGVPHLTGAPTGVSGD